MRYPTHLYIKLLKKPFNQKQGISAGQTTFIKNFFTTKINISPRQDQHPQAGIDYEVGKLKDYRDTLEVELIRKDYVNK